MSDSAATTPNVWRAIPALAARINEGCDKPTFTTHALRHLVRNAGRNGLAPHIRRIGRKILINEVGFIAWLDGQGAA